MKLLRPAKYFLIIMNVQSIKKKEVLFIIKMKHELKKLGLKKRKKQHLKTSTDLTDMM